MSYNSNYHSVLDINYHMIFCIKYRREVINDEISNRLKEIFEKICPKYNIVLKEWEYYRSSNNNSAVKPEKPIGMANPASVFCEKHGGKSINVKDKDGNEIGKCQFKDGTKVDEWDYYRENN